MTIRTLWRGAQVQPNTDLPNWSSLFDKKANLVRYQIVCDPVLATSIPHWVNNVQQSLVQLNFLLSLDIRQYKVIIDIHTPPGGIDSDNIARMFKPGNEPYLVALRDTWAWIAQRYKTDPRVYVYGVLNEPAGTLKQVNAMNVMIVSAIRDIDKTKRISVSCPYGSPSKFRSSIKINSKNIWYEVHQYYPLEITHQGVNGYPAPRNYPGQNVTKAKLIKHLQKVRDFGVANEVPIFVGEFSISAFAPIESRVKYFQDCINIFETWGWQFCVHAWRESPVWDFENFPAVAQVLYQSWNKNKKI